MIDSTRIAFCDLSSDLDRSLRFLACLSENVECTFSEEGYELSEFGFSVNEYLERRMILEHVFFRRRLQRRVFDKIRFKAELWRAQKMKALTHLKAKPSSSAR